MRVRSVLAAGAAACLLGPAAAADDVAGIWLTEGGQARVRVGPCGASRCGTIVWTKAPARDVHNPAAELRARDLVGVQMVSNARAEGTGWAGSLYNPLDGRTYSGSMRISGADLVVSGCVLGGLVCRSQTWTRVR